MAVSVALNLPSDRSAPSVARRTAAQHLAGLLEPQRLGDLQLLLTELVSNAVVHGQGEVVVRLQLDNDIVRGEVIDQGHGFEREMRVRGPDEVGGRGLMLVDRLTSRWGIHEGTTHVWFELPARAATPDHGLQPRLGESARPDALD